MHPCAARYRGWQPRDGMTDRATPRSCRNGARTTPFYWMYSIVNEGAAPVKGRPFVFNIFQARALRTMVRL